MSYLNDMSLTRRLNWIGTVWKAKGCVKCSKQYSNKNDQQNKQSLLNRVKEINKLYLKNNEEVTWNI